MSYVQWDTPWLSVVKMYTVCRHGHYPDREAMKTVLCRTMHGAISRAQGVQETCSARMTSLPIARESGWGCLRCRLACWRYTCQGQHDSSCHSGFRWEVASCHMNELYESVCFSRFRFRVHAFRCSKSRWTASCCTAARWCCAWPPDFGTWNGRACCEDVAGLGSSG